MPRVALVVGISTYKHFHDLKAPAIDAEAIAQQLEKDGEFRVTRLPEAVEQTQTDRQPKVGRTLLLNQTRLETALKQLFRPNSSQIPETALFYFSGHGIRDPEGEIGLDKGYLVASDTDPSLARSGISLAWLKNLLAHSLIKNQIIWLDCCHSGGLVVEVEAANAGYSDSRNRCFIASSRDYEKSWQDLNSSYSVLTKALLEGLNPERLRDRWIDTFSLVDYVNQALKGELQTPICTNFGDAIQLTRTWQNTEIVSADTMTDTGICPYKGLEFFDSNGEDAKYFFGRESLTDQLLDHVRTKNFMALVGASGNGKSSVLRAGLLYQLQLGRRIVGSDQWQVLLMQPDAQPMQHLAELFLPKDGSQLDRAEALGRATGLLQEGGAGLARLVKAATPRRVVIVVDQFEEVFTRCENSQEREQFFACLMGALEEAGNKLCLLVAIRSDFVGKCLEHDYSGLAKQVEAGMVSVRPMQTKELRNAICKPAAEVGLVVEDALVTEILKDVQGSPGSLPLLEYTLKELWQQRQNNQLLLSAYQALGGISGTLDKRATEFYESLGEEQKATVQYIFQQLTQLGHGTEDTRRRVFMENLIAEPQHSLEQVNQIVTKLSDSENRLTVMSTVEGKGDSSETRVVVDVAHESLIRHWRLLHKWLEKDRELLCRQRLIEDNAVIWSEKSKRASYLLHGKRYLEAKNTRLQCQQKNINLSSLALNFLQESARHRHRSQLKLSAIILIPLLFTVGTVEYFIREVNVNKNYMDLKSADTTLIHQSIEYLTGGCKLRKNYAGWFPLYIDERVFGNCRSLTGINLSGVDLSGVSLSSVDITNSNLRGVNLERSELNKAYFMGSDLSGANIQSATLQSTDFQRANLSGTNFTNSDLRNANLEGAVLFGTNFSHVSLSEIKGIEKDSLKHARFCKSKITEEFNLIYQEKCN